MHPALATALILLAVGAGGFVVWKFWTSLAVSGSGQVVVLDEKPSERAAVEAQNRAQFAMRQREERQARQLKAEIEGPDYLRPHPRNANQFVAKVGATRVTVTKPANGPHRFRAESIDPTFITAEQRQLIAASLRARTDPKIAEALKITPDQLKQLAPAPRNFEIRIEPTLQRNLDTLFTKWLAADEPNKGAASTEFLGALREVDVTIRPQTKQTIEEWAKKTREILTAEQLKGLGV